MHRLPRCLAVLFTVFAAFATLLPAAVSADPGNSAILEVRPLGGRQYSVVVHSAAMNKAVTVWISHPGGPAPALYLLNAVDGGEDGGPWTARTDVAEFFADKSVNVIVPMGGRASYYTDWVSDDPVLGRNKWSTFLIRELPALLRDRFQLTGRNAVAGTSMSATSALDLAIEAPGMYQAVGAYSGCPRTSDPLARAYVHSQLGIFGANAANMWGTPDDPAWLAHDPIVNAERLRGLALYISAGNGAPGSHDALTDPSIGGNPATLANRMGIGGPMEAVVNSCTRALTDRLAALGIPATVALRPGTHAWPYWQDDLHDSWPLFASALGI
ncbi:esterase family protein [Nocardia sp. CDC159]|uniref:Esterase family protein n=1 Tax=Nocardia pulmonis TaxID=2951408 RepID=A0A9X2ECT5_9NOCA|nr:MULTISPECIES: alpha/beta hydrolase family protein [Nocardia]MCM6775666.1 esterase family protein [Nocardia pulmonis]MCM6788358.1 esterase family protein [Nocardia sp. CDC159]